MHPQPINKKSENEIQSLESFINKHCPITIKFIETYLSENLTRFSKNYTTPQSTKYGVFGWLTYMWSSLLILSYIPCPVVVNAGYGTMLLFNSFYYNAHSRLGFNISLLLGALYVFGIIFNRLVFGYIPIIVTVWLGSIGTIAGSYIHWEHDSPRKLLNIKYNTLPIAPLFCLLYLDTHYNIRKYTCKLFRVILNYVGIIDTSDYITDNIDNQTKPICRSDDTTCNEENVSKMRTTECSIYEYATSTWSCSDDDDTHNSERHSEKRHSEKRHSEEQHSEEQHSEEQHSEEQHSEEQHSEEQHSEEQHREEQHSEEQHSEEQHSEEQHSEEQHSEEQHSEEQQSDEQYSEVQQSDEQYSEVQQSEEQHSEKQHSEKQHSEKQHGKEDAQNGEVYQNTRLSKKIN